MLGSKRGKRISKDLNRKRGEDLKEEKGEDLGGERPKGEKGGEDLNIKSWGKISGRKGRRSVKKCLRVERREIISTGKGVKRP